MEDPQYQEVVTQVGVGLSGQTRITKTRELITTIGGNNYQAVAASQTNSALGATGGKAGDYLARLIITVGTAATAATSIKDGSGSSIPILANSPGGGIGVYVVDIGAISSDGPWSVTTGAGSTVVAVGKFT